MDEEIERVEAEIRALLPNGWRLMAVGPMDDLPEPDWGDLDQETIAGIRAEQAQARVIYGWGVPPSFGADEAMGPDRLSAARAALARVRRSIVRPGEPGALDARIELVPIDLPGLPDELAGLDIAPDGRWAAATRSDASELMTQDGLRLPTGGYWPSVAWMWNHLVTLEGDGRSHIVVRARDGDVVATWPFTGEVAIGPDWIAAADTGDDPNEDMLQRLVVWHADGSVRRTWTRWVEDAMLLRLPPDGLALVAFDWDGEGSTLFLFDTADADPCAVPMPLQWDRMHYDGPAPSALGGDRFVLIRRDAIWAWSADDTAMTLIHEGPLVAEGRTVDSEAPWRWLSDGRVVVQVDDRWWLVRIVTPDAATAPR
jgi:hypothetical protein